LNEYSLGQQAISAACWNVLSPYGLGSSVNRNLDRSRRHDKRLLAISLALMLLSGPVFAESCPTLLQHELPKLRSKKTSICANSFRAGTGCG